MCATHMQAHVRTLTPHIHAHTHTLTHMYATHMQAHVRTPTPHIHAHTHSYSHTQIRNHMQAHTHAYTQKHTGTSISTISRNGKMHPSNSSSGSTSCKIHTFTHPHSIAIKLHPFLSAAVAAPAARCTPSLTALQ